MKLFLRIWASSVLSLLLFLRGVSSKDFADLHRRFSFGQRPFFAYEIFMSDS
jgi:hypothetical protein